MSVKIVLWLGLLACIDGRVIKLKEAPLTSEGLTLDIIVRNKGDRNVVSTLNIDVDEVAKKVSMSMIEETPKPAPMLKSVFVLPTDVPTINDRFLLHAPSCPAGYHKRGGFCFPSEDY